MRTANGKPLLVLAGPTGVGKSELALLLAKHLQGEIVSADSVQVYRGMDIGSAKLPADKREGIPHHLLDVWDPSDPFDVVRFQQMANEAIAAVHARGKLPILTGGTGFYIQAIARDIDFSEQHGDPSFRASLYREAEEHGPDALHRKLSLLDPEAAEQIHPNNIKRVVRALEYHALSGEPISAHNREQKQKRSPYDLLSIVLWEPRERLYEKIDRRVEQMMQDGLEQEVRAFYEKGIPQESTAMKAIGYKEFFPYFRGEYDREEAVRLIKRNTRHYAKRQLTWFRMQPDMIWINKEDWNGDHQRIAAWILQETDRRGWKRSDGNENAI